MPERLSAQSGEVVTVEALYPIDRRWVEQKDWAAAMEANICNSIRQDLALIEAFPAYSILATPNLQKTKSESQEAAQDGYIDARLVEVTLKNAQLSYLVDRLVLGFIEKDPMPVDQFRYYIQGIARDEAIQIRLERKYREMFDAYVQDTRMQELPEYFEDVFERYADTPHYDSVFLRRSIETLKWLRRGLENGEITYDGEYVPIEKRASLLKLPFTDVVFMISSNAFAYYGTAEDLKERRERKLRGDHVPTEQERRIAELKELFACEDSAEVSLAKLPHRSLVKMGRLFSDAGDLAHSIRHEVKHVIDQQILSDKPLDRYPDSRPGYSFEVAFQNESIVLVSECAALAISGDFDHETINRYYDHALSSLIRIAADDPQHNKMVNIFKRDWEPILAFLQDEDAYLRALERPAKLFIYHCIATSRTPKEVLRHLKNALDYLTYKDNAAVWS